MRGDGDEFGLLLIRPDGGLPLSHDPPQGPFGVNGGNELVPALRYGPGEQDVGQHTGGEADEDDRDGQAVWSVRAWQGSNVDRGRGDVREKGTWVVGSGHDVEGGGKHAAPVHRFDRGRADQSESDLSAKVHLGQGHCHRTRIGHQPSDDQT